MDNKRKFDSESNANEDNNRPKKALALNHTINLLDHDRDEEKVINAENEDLGEDHLEELSHQTTDKEEEEIEKPQMSESMLLQILEMANELADFLAANDDNTERSIRTRKELEALMAPYRELYESMVKAKVN
jgi:hypothetical protein